MAHKVFIRFQLKSYSFWKCSPEDPFLILNVRACLSKRDVQIKIRIANQIMSWYRSGPFSSCLLYFVSLLLLSHLKRIAKMPPLDVVSPCSAHDLLKVKKKIQKNYIQIKRESKNIKKMKIETLDSLYGSYLFCVCVFYSFNKSRSIYMVMLL